MWKPTSTSARSANRSRCRASNAARGPGGGPGPSPMKPGVPAACPGGGCSRTGPGRVGESCARLRRHGHLPGTGAYCRPGSSGLPASGSLARAAMAHARRTRSRPATPGRGDEFRPPQRPLRTAQARAANLRPARQSPQRPGLRRRPGTATGLFYEQAAYAPRNAPEPTPGQRRAMFCARSSCSARWASTRSTTCTRVLAGAVAGEIDRAAD